MSCSGSSCSGSRSSISNTSCFCILKHSSSMNLQIVYYGILDTTRSRSIDSRRDVAPLLYTEINHKIGGIAHVILQNHQTLGSVTNPLTLSVQPVRRAAITARGVVQGVGFRPFVYNAARSNG